jgi:hypothetical protein
MAFTTSIVAVLACLQGSGILSIPSLKPAPSGDKVIATADGTDIKASDIFDLLWEAKADEILSDYIIYAVVKKEADRVKISVTPEECAARVAAEREMMTKSLEPGQTIQQFMAAQGMTPSRHYMAATTGLLIDKIGGQGFDPAAYVNVSTMIFPAASDSASDVKLAIESANKAHKMLTSGTLWATVFTENVSDPEGRANLGKIGWRPLSAFPESSRKALAAGKAGTVLAPIQTPRGIQIFKIDANGNALTPQELESLKESVAPTLRSQVIARLMDKVKSAKRNLGG